MACGQTGPVDDRAEALARFGDGRLTHLPGLDGIRGLAVLAVVMFHGNWSWMAGGYLGVSLFFTLSGFLITSLLLAEHGATATIDLRGFWTRRFRRLLPAGVADDRSPSCSAWVGRPTPRRLTRSPGTRGRRWRRSRTGGSCSTGTSYGDLFRRRRRSLHFWSLAIEEQFYLVFPLVVAGLLVAHARPSPGGDLGARCRRGPLVVRAGRRGRQPRPHLLRHRHPSG